MSLDEEKSINLILTHCSRSQTMECSHTSNKINGFADTIDEIESHSIQIIINIQLVRVVLMRNTQAHSS